MKATRRFASTIVMIGLVATFSASSASAGQPWSCTCNGKTKRFIASTNACEMDMYYKTHNEKESTGKIKFKPCTSSQWKAWNRKACLSEGCVPIKY